MQKRSTCTASSTKPVTYIALAGPRQRIADCLNPLSQRLSSPTSQVKDNSRLAAFSLLDYLEEFNLEDERLIRTNDPTGPIRPITDVGRNPNPNMPPLSEQKE